MTQNISDFSITEISANRELNCFCEQWEMAVVKSGKATAVIGGKVYNLESGEAIFFAPNEFHNIIKNEASEYIFLSFNGNGELLENLKGKAVYLRQEEMSLIENAVSLTDNEYNTLCLAQGFKMLELFLLLCCEKKGISEANYKNAKLFALAAQILGENIKSNISVNELAERLDISLSNLKRVFMSLASVGTHEYYTFLKIAKAKEYLKQGISVTETAVLTGFANQAYFSAAFKRVTEKTPKEYVIGKKPKTEITPKPKKVSKKKADMPSYLL